MELQNAFYIIGIVFMSLNLIILLGVVFAILAIRAKINAIEKAITDKVQTVTNIAHIGGDLFTALRKIILSR